MDTPPREWKETGRVIYKPREWAFYRLGEAKFEKRAFRPIFPKGTKFTFRCPEILEFLEMSHYIIIYFPVGTLKELTREDLQKLSLTEIVEDVTRVRK